MDAGYTLMEGMIMTEVIRLNPARTDRRLVFLDGLSRMAAMVVMAALVLSVALISMPPGIVRSTISPPSPPAKVAPAEIEKSWVGSWPTPNFDSMYGSRSGG